jgi:multiple sugar transport system substrate-binding protein
LAVNPISITRTGENQKLPVADHIWLAKSAQGPVRRIGPGVVDVYVIWKFAENIDGAKQFLVDYIGEFFNFPCFPQTVPDLKTLLARDDKANPPDKYKVLEDALDWVTNVGYPGYANAAIDEIFNTWVLPQHVCPGRHGQADARGGPQPGGRAGAAYLPKVARTR